MAYYGSGYSQGVGGEVQQGARSYQSGIPTTAPGFYLPQSAPTVDSEKLAGQNAADKINPPVLGSLMKGNSAGAISEQQNMAGVNPWASQYMRDLAGQGASSGQMNDAYYNAAPTLGSIYDQYGSGFDPSKFTGLGDGSLMGLQHSLNDQGYGLENIGGYYQNQSRNAGPQAGVAYNFDPTFGVRGSIGGLDFDVLRAPGNYDGVKDYMVSGLGYSRNDGQRDWLNLAGDYLSAPGSEYPSNGSVAGFKNQLSNIDYDKLRQFQMAGTGMSFPQRPLVTSGRASSAPAAPENVYGGRSEYAGMGGDPYVGGRSNFYGYGY